MATVLEIREKSGKVEMAKMVRENLRKKKTGKSWKS